RTGRRGSGIARCRSQRRPGPRRRVRIRSRAHHPVRPAARGTIMTTIKFGQGRDLLAQSAWRVCFETSQRIRQALEARLKEDAGRSLSDCNALLLLWEAPGRTLTMSGLAREVVFSAWRLNSRLTVLAHAALAVESACPSGGRAHNVALAEGGARAFIAAAGTHRSYVDEMFLDHVSDEELEVIHPVFSRVSRALPE